MPRKLQKTPAAGWAPRQRQPMVAQETSTVSRTRSMACLGQDNHLPAGQHRVAADPKKHSTNRLTLIENTCAQNVLVFTLPERPRRSGGTLLQARRPLSFRQTEDVSPPGMLMPCAGYPQLGMVPKQNLIATTRAVRGMRIEFLAHKLRGMVAISGHPAPAQDRLLPCAGSRTPLHSH